MAATHTFRAIDGVYTRRLRAALADGIVGGRVEVLQSVVHITSDDPLQVVESRLDAVAPNWRADPNRGWHRSLRALPEPEAQLVALLHLRKLVAEKTARRLGPAGPQGGESNAPCYYHHDCGSVGDREFDTRAMVLLVCARHHDQLTKRSPPTPQAEPVPGATERSLTAAPGPMAAATPEYAIVDGSNIAWEGRSKEAGPSYAQLLEARQALEQKFPDRQISVVVDSPLRHQVDERERAAMDRDWHADRITVTPTGTTGGADALILEAAARTAAIVVSNDAFRRHHDEHPWIAEPERLYGAVRIAGLWIFRQRATARP